MLNSNRSTVSGASSGGASGASNSADPLDSLEAQARGLVTLGRELSNRALALTAQVRLARGTIELPPATTPPAVEPVPPAPSPEPLADRLVALLRTTPSSVEELAAALKVPTGRVSKELAPLRAGRKLWNAGTDVAPKWFLPPPADASPEVFAAAVKALISLQPHSTAELQRATSTLGSKRVWHALVKLNDATGSRLVRYGDPRRPRWFWLPEGMDLSKITGRAAR